MKGNKPDFHLAKKSDEAKVIFSKNRSNFMNYSFNKLPKHIKKIRFKEDSFKR